MAISSLAFYPNTMDGNLEKRQANVAHLMTVIRASAKLGVNMVTTFIGQTSFTSSRFSSTLLFWSRPVARRTESDDHSPHLAQGV